MNTAMALDINPNATMPRKAGLHSTPKGRGKGILKAKIIDIIEISDDSDSATATKRYHTPTPQNQHQRQRKSLHALSHASVAWDTRSTSVFRRQSRTLDLGPGASPSPSPCKSAASRAKERSKPRVVVEGDVIDISSDESDHDGPMVSPPSLRPSKRCRVDEEGSGAVVLGASPKKPTHNAHSGAQQRGPLRAHMNAYPAAETMSFHEGASGSGSSAGDIARSASDTENATKDVAMNVDPKAHYTPRLVNRDGLLSQPVASGSNVVDEVQKDGRSAPPEAAPSKQSINYEDMNRHAPSDAYRKLSIHYLRVAFPSLPKNIITSALYQHDDLYAPTCLHLHAAEQRYTAAPPQEERPYSCNATRYSPAADRRALAQVWDEAFGEEWMWVEGKLGSGKAISAQVYQSMRARHGAPSTDIGGARNRAGLVSAKADVVVDKGKGKQRAVDVDVDKIALVQEDPVEEDQGGDIECGCCFGEYTFDKMVQCPDGHLFCANCISQYAATQLGAHNPSLVCMDSSECKLAFPESELRRVLTPKLMELYERLVSQRVIAAAGFEGLEECPFCDWKCVMDVPVETESLFRCGNEEGGCGVVSCRKCKKKDHLPKTCQEVEQDQVLNGQHAIEEAMTRALMRNCPNPQCNKAFIKEAGCNKMACPRCGTLSCYDCRKVITGYDHFGRGRCKLYENVEDRHALEVRAAAEKATAELRRINPEIDHSAIKVDLPPSPAKLAAERHREQQRRQQQQQLLLQRRQAQFQDLFRRQEDLRQEDLRRQREAAQRDGEWEREERVQQQKIAGQARQAALGTRRKTVASQHDDAVGGSAPASQQTDPYARAYAHAFDMLHGSNKNSDRRPTA
ncbi:hypothetical protein D9619_007644 [Psilocybe cf. subviscida]|uniref:RING-type domain-containing protein n=1 Tax=Psilocybe cf. subviscida TaxID=2480587 RepID=A0A8H5ATS6_9AGAR|nr:hypothetical protein D9619_007644 [Psilocybe cf. subviscida]